VARLRQHRFGTRVFAAAKLACIGSVEKVIKEKMISNHSTRNPAIE
jgi:hypothetical protein